MNKPTLVIGASTNEERYSNKAIHKLLLDKHTVYAIGAKEGMVNNVLISTEMLYIENVHTITLYINSSLQEAYTAYILELQPKRLIFNPGTENETLYKLATTNGIACIDACTLVMLQTKQY
jgi:uncharacterized protein